MVDFGYLFDMYIQVLVIDFIPKVKNSPQRYFYRNTAIGRRILYRKQVGQTLFYGQSMQEIMEYIEPMTELNTLLKRSFS
jgi:hypothetical protein